MSGINWEGDDFAEFASNFTQKFRADARKQLPTFLEQLGRRGVDRVRQRHHESGTKTNPQGRFRTGSMHLLVNSVVGEEGNDKYYVKFGWPEAGVPYVKMQDQGTRDLRGRRVNSMDHGGGPGAIPAMFALHDAFVQARIELEGLK